jgi:hypothetical protein
MKLAQLHRYGEVHALRGGWWLLAPFFDCGRAICHTKGRRLYSLFDNGAEAVTCNWCRQKLGLVTYHKGPKPIPPPDEPLPATFEEAVHEGLLAGTLPKSSNDFPGYTPSILFAEPAVIDVEAEEAGP